MMKNFWQNLIFGSSNLKMRHHRFYKNLKRTTQSIAPVDLSSDKAITTFPTQLYEIEKVDAVNLSKSKSNQYHQL